MQISKKAMTLLLVALTGSKLIQSSSQEMVTYSLPEDFDPKEKLTIQPSHQNVPTLVALCYMSAHKHPFKALNHKKNGSLTFGDHLKKLFMTDARIYKKIEERLAVNELVEPFKKLKTPEDVVWHFSVSANPDDLALIQAARINVNSFINNCYDIHFSPLTWAILHEKSLLSVKGLLECGANPNWQSSGFFNKGMTPLLEAAHITPRPAIIHMLLANGAKKTLNAQDQAGNTALIQASMTVSQKPEDQGGNLERVQILIDAKADLTARNKKGRTALGEALHAGNQAVANALRNAGAQE